MVGVILITAYDSSDCLILLISLNIVVIAAEGWTRPDLSERRAKFCHILAGLWEETSTILATLDLGRGKTYRAQSDDEEDEEQWIWGFGFGA